ncbi:hypothetical protein BJ684DRAFT_16859 [Piptocephalis cylindrospora]|uniref:Uncharacterized protein n=1 Tax=Piptocephalis cylindrospora TaxID=1907219 RepID=A0A4P9Y1I8_9FUNG|nr:hypothetical protein BJ684DRAFT_16859 [Piptocephalis cylindrospora]|eukprot:RKP12678.1 hypothetical protein BJ684DRAFT_16859 [Piptocephalis cylindrospora]
MVPVWMMVTKNLPGSTNAYVHMRMRVTVNEGESGEWYGYECYVRGDDKDCMAEILLVFFPFIWDYIPLSAYLTFGQDANGEGRKKRDVRDGDKEMGEAEEQGSHGDQVRIGIGRYNPTPTATQGSEMVRALDEDDPKEMWMERGEVTTVSHASCTPNSWHEPSMGSRRQAQASTPPLPKRTSSLSSTLSHPIEGDDLGLEARTMPRVHVISDASLGYPGHAGRVDACDPSTPVVENDGIRTRSLGLEMGMEEWGTPYGKVSSEVPFSLSSDTLVASVTEWEGTDATDEGGCPRGSDSVKCDSSSDKEESTREDAKGTSSQGTSLSDLTSSQMIRYWMSQGDDEDEDDEDEDDEMDSQLVYRYWSSYQGSQGKLSTKQVVSRLSLEESYYAFQNERMTTELAHATRNLQALNRIYQAHEKHCLSLQHNGIPKAWERIRELEAILSTTTRGIHQRLMKPGSGTS